MKITILVEKDGDALNTTTIKIDLDDKKDPNYNVKLDGKAQFIFASFRYTNEDEMTFEWIQ